MTQTIQRVIYEDFNGVRTFADDRSTTGSTEIANMISPFALSADFGSTHGAINNWYNINTNVTPTYASINTGDDTIKIGLSRDSVFRVTGGSDINRAPLSRHYWSGSIKTNTSAASSCFTYSDFGGGKTSDGFLHVLEPAHNDSNSHTRISGVNMNQAGVTAELQFDNLPAFTWVPLIGCTNRKLARPESQGYSQEAYYSVDYPDQTIYWQRDGDSTDTYWLSADGRITDTTSNRRWLNEAIMGGWHVPGGISDSTANHYGLNWTDCENPHWSWNTWYLIYCHDGNGNGMLATCPGMIGKDELSVLGKSGGMNDGFMASNGAHGVSGHDGMIRWTAPTTLTNWLTADANDGGAATTRLSRLWDAYSGANATRNRNIWKLGLDESDSDVISKRGQANTSYRTINLYNIGRWLTGANNIGLDQTTLIYNFARNIYMDGLLVAYGSMGANADLSTPINLYVNRFMNSTSTGDGYGREWVDSSGLPDTYSGTIRPGVRHQQFFTGKFGSLNFTNVPGWVNAMFEDSTSAGHDNDGLDLIPGWVFQPTVSGAGRVNRFAIASYDPVNKGTTGKFGSSGWGYNTTTSAYYNVPYSDEEFLFPQLSNQRASFDPAEGASSNSSRFEHVAGAWNNVTSLLDDDDTTATKCLSSGETNALYVKLTQPSNMTGITASSTINTFTMQIQGITVPAISNNKLRVALTDSSKTTVLSSTDAQSVDFGGLTTGTGTTFPAQGSYLISMSPASTSSVAYSAVSAGYMKLWLE